MYQEIFNATIETLLMTLIPGIIAVVLGGILGAYMYAIDVKSQFPSKKCPHMYRILSTIINITRLLPFVILIIAIIPFTRLLVGTSIGTAAACVPITLAAIPFVARVMETSLSGVPSGLIEAGTSMGASSLQILTKIIIPEARNSLISGVVLMLISLIGYTAMAGVIGGGGLGAVAYNYGYLRFNNYIMVITVILIILIVQAIQFVGDLFLHRNRKFL